MITKSLLGQAIAARVDGAVMHCRDGLADGQTEPEAFLVGINPLEGFENFLEIVVQDQRQNHRFQYEFCRVLR